MEEKKPNILLRRERELKGWSQKALAARVGTNEQSVNHWESRLHKPSKYFQTQLCQLYEKSAEELGFIQPRLNQSPIIITSATDTNQPMRGLIKLKALSISPGKYGLPQGQNKLQEK